MTLFLSLEEQVEVGCLEKWVATKGTLRLCRSAGSGRMYWDGYLLLGET